METLRILDQIISEALSPLNEPPRVLPLFNLTHAHAGSDVCLRIAEKTKASALEIAQKVISKIESSYRGRIWTENGFLLITLPQDQRWLLGRDEIEPPFKGKPVSICALAHRALSGTQRARLLALAWFHSRLVLHLGGRSVVFAGDRSVAEPLELLAAPPDLSSHPEIEPGGFTFVWCDRVFGHAKEFRDWAKQISLRSLLLVKSPDPKWLEGLPSSLPSGEKGPALACQLAGPETGDEIDLSISGAKRWSNLVWWIDDTNRRLAAFHSGQRLPVVEDATQCAVEPAFRTPLPQAQGLGVADCFSSIPLDFLVRLKFFPAYVSLAAERGELWPFQLATRFLLRGANTLFNNPAFRECAATLRAGASETEILAGVGYALSDMVKLFKVHEAVR